MGYDSIKNCARIRRVRQKKLAWVRILKGIKGCSICGEKDPIVLELHHTQNDKHIKLRKRKGRSYATLNWELMKAEVDKCIILCANCHRRVTFKERGW